MSFCFVRGVSRLEFKSTDYKAYILKPLMEPEVKLLSINNVGC